jgi:hypothetical protein
MARYCLTGQSPQRAVAPTEEEEEEVVVFSILQLGASHYPVIVQQRLIRVHLHMC